jgi:hypothetical protein
MFALIVDDFTIQYIGNAHLDHLCQALKKHYKVSEEIDGTRFAGMTLKWNYSPFTPNALAASPCRAISSMSAPGTSITCPPSANSLLTNIAKCQTTQLIHVDPYSPPLSTEGVKRIQGIISTLLYYARAVDNKLLATLSTLSSQQTIATEATNVAMNQLLDYLATYPNDGTTYRVSDMILCAHTNTGFHNESKGRSQAHAHIFVSENNPFPKHNGLVFLISQK